MCQEERQPTVAADGLWRFDSSRENCHSGPTEFRSVGHELLRHLQQRRAEIHSIQGKEKDKGEV